MQNPYSQADSIIRHNETVVAILLVDNSDTKRTQHEDDKEFYKVISRDEIAGKYNKSYEYNKEEPALQSRDNFYDRRTSTKFFAPFFFSSFFSEKDKGRKSSDQVLVLVSIVILLVDRKKGGAREHENRF